MVRRRRGGMGSGATMMTMQRRDGQVATLPPPTLGIRQLEQENPKLLRKNNEPRQQLHMQTRWTSLLTGPHFDMPIAAPSTYLSYLSADYPECDLKRWCRLRVCPPQRRSRVPQNLLLPPPSDGGYLPSSSTNMSVFSSPGLKSSNPPHFVSRAGQLHANALVMLVA
ncbi:hypothetical protein EDB84DRAFT_1529488, partial [Lactarius hengduanensis]